MVETIVTRRGFLGALAAGAAGAWIASHRAELEAAGAFAAAAPPEDAYQVLTPGRAELLDAVTAQLVPTDELPGAREARVVRFIDRGLATFLKNDRAAFDGQLTELADETREYLPESQSFAALPERDQLAVLRQFERTHPQSFAAVRGYTILGMFSNPSYGGNFQKSGWRILGFQDRFFWTPPFGSYDRV